MLILKLKELWILQNRMKLQKINKDKITKKLNDIFNEEIPENGILKLIHDNSHEFKPRNKKIKFNSNIIRNIS